LKIVLSTFQNSEAQDTYNNFVSSFACVIHGLSFEAKIKMCLKTKYTGNYFEPEEDKVREEFFILHKKELHDLYSHLVLLK
jgi:hypothetical protein